MADMNDIVSLTKRRGFIFPSSEIYGGFGSSYDYGPLGVELKNNIKREWWKYMVQSRNDVVGLDSAILMHPKVWEASGHVESFTDPLVDCKKCKKRWRADHVKGNECPECGGALSEPRTFNLLMETNVGAVQGEKSKTYLRGETCQGIYVDFDLVRESTRQKIPFGIAQIGKSFRNEITPGNFTFRMREFEQMEMQYFVKEAEAPKWFAFWREQRMQWYLDLGFKKNNLRFREHGKDELAHYARQAEDIEYNSPIGWKEFEGVHNRGDWDLSRHSEFCGKELAVFDEETKEKFIPHIIETSAGADRAALFALIDAYEEIEGGRTTTTDSTKEKEVVLRFHPKIAPIKMAILPLVKKDPVANLAKEIQATLAPHWMTQYDQSGSIGRRYRRQDEIGTPYAITVDFDSLEDKKVTIRDRDTMTQERIAIAELKDYFTEKIN